MAPSKNLLMIFVKNRQAGKVKTRLAKTVGDDKALEIYEKLKSHTIDVAAEVDVDREIWYSDFVGEEQFEDEVFKEKVQIGDGLGVRMKNAFEQGFKNGAEKVVIIGSDCISITQLHIREAFAILEEADVVIGPAKDGGYYLLGLSKMIPELFENINWSTESVFDQTLEALRSNKNSYQLLEMLNDIDTESDLENSPHKSRLV